MQAICWKQKCLLSKASGRTHTCLRPCGFARLHSRVAYRSVETYFSSKAKPRKSFMPSWFPTIQQAFQGLNIQETCFPFRRIASMSTSPLILHLNDLLPAQTGPSIGPEPHGSSCPFSGFSPMPGPIDTQICFALPSLLHPNHWALTVPFPLSNVLRSLHSFPSASEHADPFRTASPTNNLVWDCSWKPPDSLETQFCSLSLSLRWIV